MLSWLDGAAELRRLRRERKATQRLATQVLQTRLAQELAKQMLRSHRIPDQLREPLDRGLLPPNVVLQKSSESLAFYRRLILGYGLAPQRVLEIGVKAGGSLQLWHALFPQARIVGLDIGPPPPHALPDAVVVVRGDQTDARLLKRIGRSHGPFDLVVDDGSHVGAHQQASFLALSRFLTPGAFYVIEDLHAVAKPAGGAVDYGDDVWGAFVAAAYAGFQKRDTDDLPLDAALRPMLRRVTELVLAPHLLALRLGRPAEPAEPADGAAPGA